jgi:hypothetical protein
MCCLAPTFQAAHHYPTAARKGVLPNADIAATSEVADPNSYLAIADWLSSASAFSQDTPRSG